MKIMVQEKPGINVKSLVSNQKIPWKQFNCTRENCLLCQGACWRSNVTYQIDCQRCSGNNVISTYIGESAKSAFSRGENHVEGLRKRDPNNVLWEHAVNQHDSEKLGKEDFKMKVTGQFRTCLPRQISEAVQISQKIEERDKQRGGRIVLNSKSQFHQPGMIKTRPTAKFFEDHQRIKSPT